MLGTPLRERKYDWIFVIIFIFFAWSSFFIDMMGALHEWILGGDSQWFFKRLLFETYADADPLFVINPMFMRVALIFSAFVWGPLYVFFVVSFIRGDNRMRIPALMYSSALTVVMLMIFATEFFSIVPGWRSPKPIKFSAFNLPYLAVPIALAVRMRRPFPFGRRSDERSQ